MSRAKGTANLAASLEVLAGAPLDAREKVPTKADLYLAANFPYPYVGLETYVVAENKKYRLIGNDVTVAANWEEVGSGAGGGGSADTEIIADDFDPTESYAVGEYVVYEGALYKCTTAHTGDWDASDFDDTQVMAEMPTPMPAADMSEIVTPLPGVMSRTKIYSPEEQVVAEWREYVDGVLKKRPLYEVTINQTNVAKNAVLVENVAQFIGCYGAIKTASNATQYESFPFPMSSYDKHINFIIASNTLTLGLSANSAAHLICVLQYTKTTDEWEVV